MVTEIVNLFGDGDVCLFGSYRDISFKLRLLHKQSEVPRCTSEFLSSIRPPPHSPSYLFILPATDNTDNRFVITPQLTFICSCVRPSQGQTFMILISP